MAVIRCGTATKGEVETALSGLSYVIFLGQLETDRAKLVSQRVVPGKSTGDKGVVRIA